MRDELNQYEMMEEKLRRELLKYEASFEPDDWTLMEEKLDNADVSYFAFSRHPYFRLAAAALFLLTSLYGVESLISTYFSPAYENTSYTNTLSVEDNTNDNTYTIAEGSKVVGVQDVLNNKNEHSSKTSSTSISKQGSGPNSDGLSNFSMLASNNSSRNQYAKKSKGNNYSEASDLGNFHESADNFISLAAHSERRMSRIPLAIPYNETLVKVENFTTRSSRRMPGKRTVKTTIRTSKTSIPTVVGKDKGSVSIGVFGSADLNFVDFSTAMQSGTSSGVELKIKPKKEGKIAIVTGVGYSRKKFKTTDVPNNPLMSFLNVEGFGNETDKNVTSTFTSEMEVVEVPLLLQYELGKESKKVKPYIEAGATVYVPVNQQYTYQSTSNWDQTYAASIPPNQENIEGAGYISEANVGLEIRGEHTSGSQKPYLGIANVNTGVNVRLSNRVNVHVEGQIKTSLVKHKLDRSIPEAELNVGSKISENKFNNRKGLHTLGLQLGVSCAL